MTRRTVSRTSGLIVFALSCTIWAEPARGQQPASPPPAPKVAPIKPGQSQRVAVPGDTPPAIPDRPREREEFLYGQRAYPNTQIPGRARLRAMEQLDEMRRAERGRLPIGSAARSLLMQQGAWVNIGPQPVNTPASGFPFNGQPFDAGRVSALAVDPTDSNIVYLGGAQGGIWKSTDGGLDWTPLGDGEITLAIGSIAIDPTSCSPAPCTTIYAGTGEQTFSGSSYYGAGVLKSTDSGMTWTQLGASTFVGPFNSGFSPGGGARIGTIAVHPANGQIVLAGALIFQTLPTNDPGASSGIYRSTDAGMNWTNVLPGAAGTQVVFVNHPVQGVLAYAALGSTNGDPDNGIYISTNGGATWTRRPGAGLNNLPTGTTVGRIELAIAPSQPDTLYVGIQNNTTGGLLGLFKSTDGGLNWSRLNSTPNYCGPQCGYDHTIIVHPSDPNVVFAGGAAGIDSPGFVGLVRTTDGGSSWQDVHNGANGVRLHVDIQSSAFSNPAAPGGLRLYIGNDGGAYSTTDVTAPAAAINWTNLNPTLSLSQYYAGLSIHPSDPNITFGGTQDNGSHRYDGAQPLASAWNIVTGGDGGWSAIDPLSPNIVYTTCQRICLFRSTSTGANFSGLSSSGINTSDRVAFIAPLVHDPTVSNRVYFGTIRVYRGSADMTGLFSWADISGGVDLAAPTGTLRAIAVAPSNPDVIYTGSSNGRVFRTTNALSPGTAWTDITTLSDLPARTITMVAVDPTNPDIAYVTFSGFSGTGSNFLDTKGHVFRTVNGGALWTDISGNLPNTPVNDIVVDPDLPGNLYVGTDVGVFETADTGATWNTLMTGLPRVAVFALRMHRPTRLLRAATHGRGMWDLTLTNFNPTYSIQSVSPATVAAGTTGLAPLGIAGVGFSAASVVNWNGSPRPAQTTFVGPSQLLLAVPDADLAVGVIAQITVTDPAQVSPTNPPGVTNALAFIVTNPFPVLNMISPSAEPTVPGAPFTLTADGLNFLANSEVRWNGSARPTTFVNSLQLTAQIPASDLTATSLSSVTVFTPGPGGGTSSGRTFIVGTAPANDNFSAAIVVPPGSGLFTHNTNTAAATVEGTDPSPPCAAGSNFRSIWFSFTPATSINAVVDTAGSAYDTVLSAWTGQPGSFTSAACDDDAISFAGPSRLNLQLAANVTVHFMVSGFGPNDGGALVFNVSGSGFAISSNPGAVTVNRGQSGQVMVTVSSMPGAFPNSVTLTCSGLPSLSACLFSSNAQIPGAAGFTSILTITTTAPGLVLPPSFRPPGLWQPLPLMLLALVMALFSVFVIYARSEKGIASGRLRFAPAGLLVIAAAITVSQLACGGGGGGAPPQPPRPGTPTGTLTVTVIGTSGTITSTTTVTLTVR